MQFVPAAWLELAAANRPMIVYSRTVEFGDDQPRPGSRKLTTVEEMLADLCPAAKQPTAHAAA